VTDLETAFPQPVFYVPFRHGRYDVAPGLVKFGRGEFAADARVFQFDETFGAFRRAKQKSRGEGVGKYYCTSGLTENVAEEAARFIVRRLVVDCPDAFSEASSQHGLELSCGPLGETLSFDGRMRLLNSEYVDALDALAAQVQEDFAIVSSDNGRHWLSAAHVCLPNGWAPAEKVGGTFADVHAPVAGMAEMNRRGDELAKVMLGAVDGLVRFAWGVTFDDELNHHPDRPRAAFDPTRPRAFVRVERQTIWGLPRVGAALFTIRTYVYDCERFRAEPALRLALGSALRSMSAESRVYKGLGEHFDELVAWIEQAGKA
jgi:hypothetical protein